MKKQNKKTQLDERGIAFNLFNYLQNEETHTSSKIKQPFVNIPDTIYYKFGQPVIWYFTDSNGQVKKKMKNNLTVEAIQECFLNKTPECNIVAFFISINHVKTQDYKFEFFNQKSFCNFIMFKSYDKEGYLQRFIQSKGIYNTIIKAIWSPQICFFEKYVNKLPINDISLDIYQRVINIETFQNQCETINLKGKFLSEKLDQLTSKISQHIEKVSPYGNKIKQMELIYKMDQKNKIYLILCQNIKTEEVEIFFYFFVWFKINFFQKNIYNFRVFILQKIMNILIVYQIILIKIKFNYKGLQF
ncbi:hypothetical protein IMG5_010830 [Ichthyophthirius multifiliis]|uniref:Uncharacterized protein n=1 Tax=Ichthyophthirius multifiliis TaxID=5932 RepID=G0QJZ6_ICHMU|nr:hypothetical protein IMG5_010830 [Ichthyophthirius multifiliis]EGR34456.1 hypothetical protein IMG5_010830 [Ichthyophthirius multifiliis]|eukprot:XP_004039760.1 hypothetical protein IMG5_010830 [Ichthyophthirius multifiliis]